MKKRHFNHFNLSLCYFSIIYFFSYSIHAQFSNPITLDEGQPKIVASTSVTCNITSYPLFLTTHLPLVTTATLSHWDKNKEGDCLQTQKANVLRELGQDAGPVVACLLPPQPSKKEKKKKKKIKSL